MSDYISNDLLEMTPLCNDKDTRLIFSNESVIWLCDTIRNESEAFLKIMKYNAIENKIDNDKIFEIKSTEYEKFVVFFNKIELLKCITSRCALRVTSDITTLIGIFIYNDDVHNYSDNDIKYLFFMIKIDENNCQIQIVDKTSQLERFLNSKYYKEIRNGQIQDSYFRMIYHKDKLYFHLHQQYIEYDFCSDKFEIINNKFLHLTNQLKQHKHIRYWETWINNSQYLFNLIMIKYSDKQSHMILCEDVGNDKWLRNTIDINIPYHDKLICSFDFINVAASITINKDIIFFNKWGIPTILSYVTKTLYQVKYKLKAFPVPVININVSFNDQYISSIITSKQGINDEYIISGFIRRFALTLCTNKFNIPKYLKKIIEKFFISQQIYIIRQYNKWYQCKLIDDDIYNNITYNNKK